MALVGQIVVTTEQLKAKSVEVCRLVSSMKEEFENLKNDINGTSGYWSGKAGDTHRKKYMQKMTKIEEMLSRYSEHAKDLEIMAGVYEEAEVIASSAASDMPLSTLD